MNPTRDIHATLVDLLDRVLDKGLLLDADLLILVAGIPLLGVKLKAALAGMETMLQYGIWADWDEAQRAIATEEERRTSGVPLLPGEEVRLKTFASQRHPSQVKDSIYHSWRPGQLYVTDSRVLLFRKKPAEILFQCPYSEIKSVSTVSQDNIAGKATYYVCLALSSGEVTKLHAHDVLAITDAIKERMEALGLPLAENLPTCVDEMAMTAAQSAAR